MCIILAYTFFYLRIQPRFVVIPIPTNDEFKQFYSPKIIYKQLSDNKRIEPPLEYSNSAQSKVSRYFIAYFCFGEV